MRHFLAFAAATIVANVFGQCPPTNTSLKAVNIPGYIMDNLCIQMGYMIDNPQNKTLVSPQLHSIHCLADLTPCVQSNYAVLAKLDQPTANATYRVAYQLGDDGSKLAVQYALAAKAKNGVRGFQASVSGYYDGQNPLLQCVTIDKKVNVDGKDLQLSDADLSGSATAATTTATTTTAAPTAAPTTTKSSGAATLTAFLVVPMAAAFLL
ncbi:hypothetical protein AC1031_010811 [Aphanomyces cochlioides]|nr:hypothetical protein AC1031_010811 [Aphanomyces cochlioides]